MAKRKDDRQGDFFVTDALVYTAAQDALVGEVLEAIQDVLPPGVPTYVKEVRSAVRDALGTINTTLVVFDGQIHKLSISGPKGARGYNWLPPHGVPFGWDADIKAWRRYPAESAIDVADQPRAAPQPAVAMTPGERLMAAGLVDATWVRLGGDLRDPEAPEKPRSLATPLFAKVFGTGEVRLFLTFPTAGDLPFVRRIEAVSGLKAVWDYDELDSPFRYRRHHAEDLATDDGWESLAATLEHTTTDDVVLYAARAIIEGRLSVANARALLEAAGCSEPKSHHREAAISKMEVHPSGQISPVVDDAWAVVHAVENGLLKPGGWYGTYRVQPSLTDTGRVRFGLPPKRQPKAV